MKKIILTSLVCGLVSVCAFAAGHSEKECAEIKLGLEKEYTKEKEEKRQAGQIAGQLHADMSYMSLYVERDVEIIAQKLLESIRAEIPLSTKIFYNELLVADLDADGRASELFRDSRQYQMSLMERLFVKKISKALFGDEKEGSFYIAPTQRRSFRQWGDGIYISLNRIALWSDKEKYPFSDSETDTENRIIGLKVDIAQYNHKGVGSNKISYSENDINITIQFHNDARGISNTIGWKIPMKEFFKYGPINLGDYHNGELSGPPSGVWFPAPLPSLENYLKEKLPFECTMERKVYSAQERAEIDFWKNRKEAAEKVAIQKAPAEPLGSIEEPADNQPNGVSAK